MNNPEQLPWLKIAYSFLGLKEVKGSKHNPAIIKMLEAMGKFSNESKAWWRDDETPWCGLFVGYCLGEAGRYVTKNWYRALSWRDDTSITRLDKPCYGSIFVTTRTGGGHVGFVVGRDSTGSKVAVLGGNQSDMVKLSWFNKSSGVYLFPSKWDNVNKKPIKSQPLAIRYTLPVVTDLSQDSSLA